MNDEFLHALRRDPPPAFARELRQRLHRLPRRRSAMSSLVRAMLAMVLIGGVAIAAALLLRNRDEPIDVTEPIAKQAAPGTPASESPPTVTPRSNQPASSAKSSPLPIESESKEAPVVLVTSSLARPLAEGLVEQAAKYGGGAPRARLMTMDDDESFRVLCGGANGNTDFVMTSRHIAEAESALCQQWRLDVGEWKLGYQAVVLAAAPTTELPALTPREVFLAVARRIPDPAEPSRLIDNPNTTWRDVDARFDNRSIDVLMPLDATTRAAFLQLVMEAGCETYPWIRKLKQDDRPRYDDICHQLRGDERVREVALSNTLVTQQLWAQPNWLVVVDYSYYAAYRRELSVMLEGPAPTAATLTDGSYAAARPVYVYAQKSHLYWPAGSRAVASELTSPSTVGPQGTLVRRGLIPLDDLERRQPNKERSR
jgi:phosphate transport system substrate-binding protein